MDSEWFDGLVRSFGQSRSRRQTLRGLAGAGALLALLVAKPGEEATAGERPHERLHDRTPQRNRKQRKNNQNNQNNNQNNNDNDKNQGPGNGQLGTGNPEPLEPSPECQGTCDRFNLCLGACEASPGCFEFCFGQLGDCEDTCLNA
jgi:hypothetical protein